MPILLALWSRFSSYITLGLAATALATSGMWYVTSLRLAASEAAREADIQQFSRAQAEAEVIALQERSRIEQEYEDRAEERDQELSDLLVRYNASLVRYANRSQTSGPVAPAQDRGTEGSNGPSESPVVSLDMILIPYTDAEICSENTARLQVVRDWVLNDLNDVE
jgi:hypothetical protein